MKKIYNNKILMIFFILQPIIDILTNLIDINISIGIIIRSIFLLYALFYIIKNGNKYTYIYIGMSIIYILTNLIGHTLLNDNFNILTQIINLVHLVYYPICLLFFYKYFKNNELLKNETFIYSSLIIGISLLISLLTKSNICAYHMCVQHGTTGWFNSANEYGIIMLYLFSISMIEILNKNKLAIISYILLTIFLIMLGTKTSYFGIIIINLGYFFFYILGILFKKKIKYSCIFLIILIASVLIFPKTPLYYNIVLRTGDGVTDVIEDIKKDNPELSDQEIIEKYNNKIEESKKTTVAFNGRDDFVKINKQLYKKANIFEKFFGITTQNNTFEKELWSRLSEMDIYDVLIYYGIFALILDLLLPLYILFNILKKIFKDIKIVFKEDIILNGIILALYLLVLYFAGHVLLQPAVSIYFAYLLITVYEKVVIKP